MICPRFKKGDVVKLKSPYGGNYTGKVIDVLQLGGMVLLFDEGLQSRFHCNDYEGKFVNEAGFWEVVEARVETPVVTD